MVLSRQSWHYRLLEWTRFPIPRTLCGYFWTVVLKLPFFFSVLVLISPIIALVFGTLALREWYRDRYPTSQHRTFRKPNVLVEYLKAAKRKVCPVLEWRD